MTNEAQELCRLRANKGEMTAVYTMPQYALGVPLFASAEVSAGARFETYVTADLSLRGGADSLRAAVDGRRPDGDWIPLASGELALSGPDARAVWLPLEAETAALDAMRKYVFVQDGDSFLQPRTARSRGGVGLGGAVSGWRLGAACGSGCANAPLNVSSRSWRRGCRP